MSVAVGFSQVLASGSRSPPALLFFRVPFLLLALASLSFRVKLVRLFQNSLWAFDWGCTGRQIGQATPSFSPQPFLVSFHPRPLQLAQL